MQPNSSAGEGRPPFQFDLPAPEETPIVVVDDEPGVLKVVGRALEPEGYPVETFESAEAALARIGSGGVSLLISDLRMPEMDGMELIRRALGEEPNLAVIVLTGAAETATAVESLRLGVDDYLQKPVAVDSLIEAVERALRKRAQAAYRNRVESWLRSEVARLQRGTAGPALAIDDTQEESEPTLGALVRAAESRNPHFSGHSERVAELCDRVGRQLSLEDEELTDLRTAGMLHDIGMIAVPDSIVSKEGQLNEEDVRTVQRHVEIGAEIIRHLPRMTRVAEYVLCHHERLNGSGYPRGLKGLEVPLGGQVLALAETYASLTERRAYRRAYSAVDALDTLQRARDVWFEGRVVDALEEILQEEPSLREAE